MSAAFSVIADAVVALPSAVQCAPPSVEYCHSPLASAV